MRTAGAAMLLALLGCGYALVGKGSVSDPSIRRVGVPLFKDLTGKPGLDQKITQKVIEELLKRRLDVVQQAEGVDALVEGEITGYNATPVGFSEAAGTETRTEASRYAILVVARVKYSKIGQAEPIWANDSFPVRDEYEIASQETFFDREDQAIERLATNFARLLVAAMLEAF